MDEDTNTKLIMSETHVNLGNAGRPGDDDTYRKVIEGIQADRVCPFCAEHLLKYHKLPILKETDRWIITTNMYPYKNAKLCFLLIHREHINDTKDMPPESFLELQEHIKWLVDEYKCPGGTLVMRCGDTSLTGATVTHLHAHLIVADYENPDREPVLARVG